MVQRRIRQKSWVYLVAATPEIAVTSALVNGAITGSGFLMVTDLQTGEVIADTSRKGALASVNDAPGDGLRAAYRLPGTRYALRRDGDVTRFRASVGRSIASLPGQSQPWIEVDLTLTESGDGDHGNLRGGARHGVVGLRHGQDLRAGCGRRCRRSTGRRGPRAFSLDGGIGGIRLHQGLPAPEHRVALGLRDRSAGGRDRPRLQPLRGLLRRRGAIPRERGVDRWPAECAGCSHPLRCSIAAT